MPLVIAYDDVKTSKATRRSGAEAPGGVTETGRARRRV